GGVTISVLGTAFNVKKSDVGTEGIVESGMVKVTAGERETVLRAGQKVTAYTANAQFEEGPAGDRLYHYYVDKQFVLTDTPLWRIIEVLEQAYDTKIVIAREELRHLRLTTTLRLGSLERNLEVITETFGITAEKQQGKWVL